MIKNHKRASFFLYNRQRKNICFHSSVEPTLWPVSYIKVSSITDKQVWRIKAKLGRNVGRGNKGRSVTRTKEADTNCYKLQIQYAESTEEGMEV